MYIFSSYLRNVLVCCSGYYCLQASSNYSVNPCPAGHYCPENTTSATQYKCPIGTFNPNMLQTDSTSCLSCTGGQYCDGRGLAAPAGNCRYVLLTSHSTDLSLRVFLYILNDEILFGKTLLYLILVVSFMNLLLRSVSSLVYGG